MILNSQCGISLKKGTLNICKALNMCYQNSFWYMNRSCKSKNSPDSAKLDCEQKFEAQSQALYSSVELCYQSPRLVVWLGS